MIALVSTVSNKLVTLQIVPVRPLKNSISTKHALLISWTFTFLKCCSITVDGGWGSWSSWSSCSATCDGGRRTRQRLCNNPLPSRGGNNCTGGNSQEQTCNTADCPGKASEELNKACVLVLLDLCILKCCSIAEDGGWGSWSSWLSCSATCGGGQRTRQRLCNNPPPSGGGSDCVGNNSQQGTCNTAGCPSKAFEESNKARKPLGYLHYNPLQ